jgi:hypothetical protein
VLPALPCPAGRSPQPRRLRRHSPGTAVWCCSASRRNGWPRNAGCGLGYCAAPATNAATPTWHAGQVKLGRGRSGSWCADRRGTRLVARRAADFLAPPALRARLWRCHHPPQRPSQHQRQEPWPCPVSLGRELCGVCAGLAAASPARAVMALRTTGGRLGPFPRLIQLTRSNHAEPHTLPAAQR